MDLRETVDSMATLVKPKTSHPWWALAAAVQKMMDSGKYPDAVDFISKEFNKKVGNKNGGSAG